MPPKKIRRTVVWVFPEGCPEVSIDQWITECCDVQEQEQYYLSRRRQDALRQAVIDSGAMVMEENGDYVWKDTESFTKGKENDPVWLTFFERYQKETGARYKDIITEEDD